MCHVRTLIWTAADWDELLLTWNTCVMTPDSTGRLALKGDNFNAKAGQGMTPRHKKNARHTIRSAIIWRQS
jgi:hypothetical protein